MPAAAQAAAAAAGLPPPVTGRQPPRARPHLGELVGVEWEDRPAHVAAAPPARDRLRLQLAHRLPLLGRLLRCGDDVDDGLAALRGAARQQG
jgi:hypothetical protein